MRWRTKRGERFLAASSGRSRAFFALAVLFIFSALAVLLDVPRTVHPPLWGLVAYAAIFGITGLGYVFATLYDLRVIPLAIALHVGSSVFAKWVTRPGQGLELAAAAQHQRLVVDAFACFVLVMLGYIFFIRFIHRVARGHAELQTEITLARRIHDALVPLASGRAAGAAYYGRSLASGAIGGDLVDVVERPVGTTFYVADVSGHGVGAGVLMAMLRSTARAALADGATLRELLRHLNRTICELERPGLFATCAVLQLGRSGTAQYALAGHLPILKKSGRTGEIAELGLGSPPLGLGADREFESVDVDVGPGDVFLIITDGLTEVFRRDGSEFGVAGIRRSAFDRDGAPADMAERVFAAAAGFGKQLDDQTVLIVKVDPERGRGVSGGASS